MILINFFNKLFLIVLQIAFGTADIAMSGKAGMTVIIGIVDKRID